MSHRGRSAAQQRESLQGGRSDGRAELVVREEDGLAGASVAILVEEQGVENALVDGIREFDLHLFGGIEEIVVGAAVYPTPAALPCSGSFSRISSEAVNCASQRTGGPLTARFN